MPSVAFSEISAILVTNSVDGLLFNLSLNLYRVMGDPGERSKANEPAALPVSGWREWVGLPGLSIRSIKAKIDSGARSSCLHAFDMELIDRDGTEWVRFAVHPIQRRDDKVVWCEAPIHDRRLVRSSNGVVTQRVVIRTELKILGQTWPIDLTLHNRDAMGFRMLIGREAVRGRFLIDSGGSYFAGRPKRSHNTHKS